MDLVNGALHDTHQVSRENNVADGDSDDDLERVAAVQRTLTTPVITTVKQAKLWIAQPESEKTAWVDISMALFTMRKFSRGWFLNLIDSKRAANFEASKKALESIPFSIRKKYMAAVTLYLVPFNSTGTEPVPDITFREGSILHCVHVTGFGFQNSTGMPKGNVTGLNRITEELAGSQGQLRASQQEVESEGVAPILPPSAQEVESEGVAQILPPSALNNSARRPAPKAQLQLANAVVASPAALTNSGERRVKRGAPNVASQAAKKKQK
ncbi:hypothetical protein PF004_g26071 [Phytophthora fragariae]|uniref:Uncharacterized protein n=1 Tax=Phytophthora fragariae TaxID=53985 RepID=A0A6G0MPG9_9STRA|nr:hypothetical protein PF003_g3701 [Phytophthora fragariae]KAE9176487.1 hypothetical protein PF004_g26071 [Phytophthora fragariae]